jgi:WD40 repeat protein/energy-coupling factor transporter ATP-binding protein EcfA2
MPKYDVFLSYNRADRSAVELIARRLREEVGLEPFLDRWHLVPGEPWQEALEEALAQSLTVAVFVGPSGISPWHNEELRAALDDAVRRRDEYRVIPVLLPDAAPESVTGFLARRTWVDFRSGLDDAEAFERLVAGIKGEAIVSEAYTLPDEPAPYRGLLRFEAEQARFFFGREADCQRLVEKLEQHVFVALVGASGSGKSSLVRAGLLPELAGGALSGSREWHLLVFTPGSHPLRGVAEQLATLLPPADRFNAADELTDRLGERADGLRTAVTTLLADRPQPLLLVVDQFEELFTLCQEGTERCRAQAEQFVANLADAIQRGDGRMRVLITLRADFLDRCLAFSALRDLLQDRQVLLGPLDVPALREAIVRPAQAVGAFFEKGLVNTILRDVEAVPGALPLLQHALFELWHARRGPWLTLDAYEASGGVRGALQRRAQDTYEMLNPAQQSIARNIFLRLTALGEGVSDTRRRVSRAELYPAGVDSGQVDTVLQTLSGPQARLIVADARKVEVSHEALIQGWSTLREWLEANRQALRVHRHLTQAALEWDALDRDPGELYRGARLAEAEEWAEAHAADLNPLERAFLEASVEEREARRIAARRRVQGIIAALVMVSVVISVLAARASIERKGAIRQASLLLAEQSVSQLDADYDLALLLAVEAGQMAHTIEAEAALHQALTRQGPMTLLIGHAAAVKHAAWDKAGMRIVTVSSDGTTRVWDAESGTELLTLFGHTASVEYAAWNGTGTRIVTTSRDGTARVWDADSGAELAVLKGHTGQVNYAVWSRADTQIVTTSADGTARVWDVSAALNTGGSGAELTVFKGHHDLVYQAAWDETGRRILTVGDDGMGRVWDAASGTERLTLTGHTDRVWQAAWNKAGTRIVTAGADGTVRVWDAEKGTELAVLKGYKEPVYQAAWNGAGTRIASAGADGTVRLWEVESGNQLAILTDHTASVLQVGWTATDKQIIATSIDGRAWIWEAESGEEVATLTGHAAEVFHAAWNGAGTRIVTAGADGIARVRAVEKGIEVAALAGHTAVVRHAAWNEAGTHLVTVSDDRTARVWDVENRTQVTLFTGHTAAVRHAAWNRRGTYIVTASDDHTARVWDAASGAELVVLSGHMDRVNHTAWNEAGTRIVTASSDGTARVWDAGSGAKLATLIGHTARVFQADWNQAGTQIVTASDDGTARVWDAERGIELAVLSNHNGPVYYAAWNKAGTRIVTASADGTARVWNARNGAEVVPLIGHTGGILHAAWNGGGTRIVTAGSDGTARVWDAKSGAELATLAGHKASVEYAAWNSGDTRIVTAGLDGTAWMWDAQSGAQIAPLHGHTAPVLQAAWNSAGTRIATVGLDGTVRVYYARLSDLLEAACQRAVRNMTEKEWKRYMGGESHRATCPNLPALEPSAGPTPSREG